MFNVSLFCQKTFFTKKKGQKRKRVLTAARFEFRGINAGLVWRENRLNWRRFAQAGFCVHPQEI
jgi:hypothetical protein